MPGLPVIGDEDGAVPQAPPPTIHLSYGGVAVGLSILVAFLAGDMLLPGWLGIDLDCLEGEYRRRASLVEMALCSVAAGPAGWLYLGWFAAPFVLLGFWLRRALRRAGQRR